MTCASTFSVDLCFCVTSMLNFLSISYTVYAYTVYIFMLMFVSRLVMLIDNDTGLFYPYISATHNTIWGRIFISLERILYIHVIVVMSKLFPRCLGFKYKGDN